MRVNVDVFVMSVMLILCILEMVVIGICEMSMIVILLEECYLVFIFVGFYDEGQVVVVIWCEFVCEGQVFYIYNCVQFIEKIVVKLCEFVLEVWIVIVYGQMNEKQLEQIMVDFWECCVDVLVCMMIVELGIDIFIVNILFID